MEIQEKDLQVLAKLLGMLGSENPHERAAFGAKAHAWVSQRGLAWSELLIPPEDAPVEVEVSVGGQKTAHATPSGGATRSPPPPPHNPHRPGFAQAQAASQGQTPGGQSWGHTQFPPWKALAEKMLKDHAPLMRGSKENAFLADQIARALQYGMAVRVSDKQEAWMRDILGRAGLTW